MEAAGANAADAHENKQRPVGRREAHEQAAKSQERETQPQKRAAPLRRIRQKPGRKVREPRDKVARRDEGAQAPPRRYGRAGSYARRRSRRAASTPAPEAI